MYKISKKDINDIYASFEDIAAPDVSGTEITSGAIDLEVNEPGTLTFTLRHTHPAVGTLRKRRDVIRTITDGWRYNYFRVIDTSKDFFNNEIVTCEGGLGILGDYYCKPIYMDVDNNRIIMGEYDGYASYNLSLSLENLVKTILLHSLTGQHSLPYYNATVNNIVEPTNAEELATLFTGESTVLQAIHTIIENYGGFVSMGNIGHVDFTMGAAPGAVRTQAVEYGKNLIDLTINENADGIYTSCLGLGDEKEDVHPQNNFGNNSRVTAKDRNGVLSESVYVDYSSDLITRYGRRVIVKQFDGLKHPNSVYLAAKRYIKTLISQSVSISIKAIDLRALDSSVEGFTCGDLVPIKSTAHGIDDSYLCSKAHIDLTDLSQTSYIFGATPKTLSAMAARAK